MWERAQVGFGGTGRKRKGPCTKQCAWQKHGSCDTRLVEACPPELRNVVKYSVEEMRPKWPFWKHRAPEMRLVEAQCAHRKHCCSETPLGSHPTSRVSHRSAQGSRPEIECFWAPGLECPKECLLSAFWRFFSPKSAKSTQKAHFGALRARCPKALEKRSVGHFPARGPGHSCKWRPREELS